jgi:hypothetical protein
MGLSKTHAKPWNILGPKGNTMRRFLVVSSIGASEAFSDSSTSPMPCNQISEYWTCLSVCQIVTLIFGYREVSSLVSFLPIALWPLTSRNRSVEFWRGNKSDQHQLDISVCHSDIKPLVWITASTKAHEMSK